MRRADTSNAVVVVLSILGVIAVIWFLAYANQPRHGEGEPEHETAATKTFDVELLFTHDGVKVYRFFDTGHWHYYAVAPSGASTSSGYNCGKNCTTDEVLQTVKK